MKTTLSILAVSVLVAVVACAPTATLVHAQSSLSVTVTPPLFQLTIGPGESWTSSIKIVNNNPYDVTYYTQLVDMQANGEDGRSKFTPLVNETPTEAAQSYALARWVTVTPGPIDVKAGSSQEVPFSVTIPQQAEPGGHYAAILVGTEPGGLHASGTLLKVSSFVSSLLFVRIKGDVAEGGRIREFLTSQELYQTPRADFMLRFENTGNTHVLPQGNITIYNMWGKERGNLQINQDGNFGNVLPKTIRRFEFSWEGDQDPFDIGLYSAVVTLAFGDGNKQNVTAKTYFWVVPIVPVVTAAGVMLFFILLIAWFIRRYIRRALMLEQKRLGLTTPVPAVNMAEALIEPIREGVVDLRSIASKKSAKVTATQAIIATVPARVEQSPQTMGQWLKKYRLFIVFLVVLLVGCLGLWLYFNKVLVHSRGFQITDVHIQEEAASTTGQQ